MTPTTLSRRAKRAVLTGALLAIVVIVRAAQPAVSPHIGIYEITPLSHLEITAGNGVLWAQGTGQPKLRLSQTSAHVFRYEGNAAQITFVVASSGETTGLLLRQGQADWPAPKMSRLEAARSEERARLRLVVQRPEPDTEAQLKRYLDCLRVGGAPCQVRNAALAQFDRLHPEAGDAVRRLGKVKRIDFKGVARGSGLAVYEARFEHGLSQWYVNTNRAGELTTALHVPLPAPPEHRLDREAFLAEVGQHLADSARAERFSGVVLVADGDRVLFEQAYGLADRERRVPNRIDTRFSVGSIDKMFTAVATMQLIEAGRIRLNDTLDRFLPDYPDRTLSHTATVQQLLSHTAGAGDIFDPAFAEKLRDAREPADYVRVLASRPPTFVPGSNWAYSNYGFVLLGRVIEVATQAPYDDVIDRQVFARASMNQTGAPPAEAGSQVAKGYTRSASGWQPMGPSAPSRRSPAGGSHSTVEDLLRFANALRSNTLVSASGTGLLTRGRIGTGTGRYGFGFQSQSIGGVSYFGHAGDAPGLSAELRMIEGSRYVVIVLSNFSPPSAPAVADFITVRLAGLN